jgi:adenosine deaminase
MLPLADLHRHLDGSLRRSTVDELAGRIGVPVPEPLCFQPGMGLRAALDRFAFTLALLREPGAVRRVASEMCEDAAAEGVTTLEVRFAPQLHAGAPPEAVIDAALEGLDGRAGLVLCGLYGEPPEVLGRLVEAAATRPGVVGIDLAGGPLPTHRWRLEDYAPVYLRAADLGLGRTVHAGEGRPPAEIAVAIEALRAQRVGHGTTILDDPRVVDLAIQRGITIEACVTSNWQVGAIATIDDHPLPQWLDAGLAACVCVDNTLFSDLDMPQELERVARIPGMDPGKLERVIRQGHATAFCRK